MGWYGTYCENNLHSIKKVLENGIDRIHTNGTKQTLLYHSFKFGRSYMAIEHISPDEKRQVFAVVNLWRYDKTDGQVMVKTIEETGGPNYYDAPMKLLKMLTDPMNNWAHDWRVTCWKNYKNIPKEYLEYKD